MVEAGPLREETPVARRPPTPTDGTEVEADTPELRERVKQALEAEGFRWELWQKPERGMVFGMIRHEEEHMQTHVRYFEGGILKAEREIGHRYIEHLISPRESAHDEIERLLEEHGIDEVVVEEKTFPDRMQGKMPETRTPWKPLVLGVGAAIAGIVLGGKNLLSRGRD